MLRCLRCGGPGQEYAHRRTRSVGGPHRHCTCNAWLACRACHRDQHANPARAMELGLAVSAYFANPGRIPITSWIGELLLGCDGTFEII
jgi:hypothetical protein